MVDTNISKGEKGFVTTDNVAAKHPDYVFRKGQWDKCRHCAEGEDAVKDNGVRYLPQLKGQSLQEYSAYKSRASFYAATGRTVDGILGIMFRKDPTFAGTEFNSKALEWKESLGAEHESFTSFAESCGRTLLTTGFGGVLIDFPEAAPAGTIPYWAKYQGQSVINWRTASINGDPDTLVLLVLEEVKEEPRKGSDFEYETKTYYRVLELVVVRDGDSSTMRCRHRLYSRMSGRDSTKNRGAQGQAFILEENEKYLVSDGRYVDFIPFVFITPEGNTAKAPKPPVLDIANVNLSHYRNSADLEHGRHFTALPTPWAAGFKSESDSSLYIGSSKAWVSENVNAKCGFLEYTGQGLSALERALETKENQMAVLGARMLEEPKKAVEAADTHRMRNLGEQSITANLADALEESLQRLLNMTNSMQALSTPGAVAPTLTLNKDFEISEISPQLLTALFDGVQRGVISYSTLFYNMKRGELTPEGSTYEKELDDIELLMPRLLGLSTGEDTGNSSGGQGTTGSGV